MMAVVEVEINFVEKGDLRYIQIKPDRLINLAKVPQTIESTF
jgi:hypothetical protein